MTSYSVQFELPVDNPVSNVSMMKRRNSIVFFVPINHPDAHNMGFQDLVAAQSLSGLLKLPSALNNKILKSSEE